MSKLVRVLRFALATAVWVIVWKVGSSTSWRSAEAPDCYLAPVADNLTGHRPGPGRRTVGLVRVPQATDRGTIAFERGFQDL